MKKLLILFVFSLLLLLLLGCEDKTSPQSSGVSTVSSQQNSVVEDNPYKEHLPTFELSKIKFIHGSGSVNMHSSISLALKTTGLNGDYVSELYAYIYKNGEEAIAEKRIVVDGEISLQKGYLDTSASYSLRVYANLTVNDTREDNVLIYEKDISFKSPDFSITVEELGGSRGIPSFFLKLDGKMPEEIITKATVSNFSVSNTIDVYKSYFDAPYKLNTGYAISPGECKIRVDTVSKSGNVTHEYTHLIEPFTLSYDMVECVVSNITQEKDTVTISADVLNEFYKLNYYNIVLEGEDGSIISSPNYYKECVFSASLLMPNTKYIIKAKIYEHSTTYEREIGSFTTPNYEITPIASVENIAINERIISLDFSLEEVYGCVVTGYGIYLYNENDSVCIHSGDKLPTSISKIEYGFCRAGESYKLGVFCSYTYGASTVKDYCLYEESITVPEHNQLPTLTIANKNEIDKYIYFEGNAGTADEATYVVEFYKGNVLIRSNTYTSLPTSVYTGLIEENDAYTVRVYADLFYYNILHRIDRFLVMEEEINPTVKPEITEYYCEIGDIRIDGDRVYFDYLAIAPQYSYDYYLYIRNSKGELVQSSVFTAFYSPETYEENLNYVTDKTQLYLTHTIEGLKYTDTYTIQFVQRVSYFGSDKYRVTAEKSFAYETEEEKPLAVIDGYEVFSTKLILDYTLSEKYFSKNCNVTLYVINTHNNIVTGLYCLDSFSPYNLKRQTVFESLEPDSSYRIFAEYYYQGEGAMQRRVESILEFTTLYSPSTLPYVTVKDVSLPPYSALGNLTYTVHASNDVLSSMSNLTVKLYGHTNNVEIKETDLKVGSELYSVLRYPTYNTIAYERLYTIVFTADFTLEGKEYEDYELLRYEHSTFRLDSTGTFEYYIEDNTIAVITGYKSNLVYCVIPEKIDGYPVMAIGEGAFENNKTLETIYIGKNVLDIMDNAFKGCSNLYHIKFNKNLLYIGKSAFEGCSSLKFVDLANTECNIGMGAFKNCDNIEKVVLGDTSFIESYAFYDCDNLKQIIARSVGSVEEYTFYGCSALSLAELNSATSVEDYAFYGCTALENARLGKNLSSIGSYAFYGCTVLRTIDTAHMLRAIGDFAFYGCYFDYLHITDSLVSIGKGAFEEASISYLTLPKTLISIGENAFNTASPIGTFVYDGTLADWCGISFENKLSNPAFCAEAWFYNYDITSVNYSNSSYKLIIPLGVTKIGDYQFAGFNTMSVYIPGTVTSIGKNAFDGCTSMTKLYFEASVKEIGRDAFLNCPINTFVFKGTVEDWCHIKLENANSNPVLRNTAVKFDNYYSESLLPNICIPASVQEIGAHQFKCFKFDTVYIEDGITRINYGAFDSATVKYLRLPTTIQYLANKSLTASSASIYYCGNINQWNSIEFDGTLSNPQNNMLIKFYLKNPAGYYTKP